MDLQPFGFRELEHTADWQLEVWAPDPAALFEQAARGMYWISGVQLQLEPRQTRRLELAAQDMESLLVKFLAELLHFEEQEQLAFDTYEIDLETKHLRAVLTGCSIASIGKEIKAVTFHNLAIRKINERWMVRIVFDV